MKSRKIFSKVEVDYSTGEIMQSTTQYVSKNTETFFMGRTTEGLEWLLEFKNLTELQLFIFMLELENPKNKYIITFTGLQVEETAKILGVSAITIKKAIQSLIKNNFLKRVAKSNFIANPLTFFKGGQSVIQEKLQRFNSIGSKSVTILDEKENG